MSMTMVDFFLEMEDIDPEIKASGSGSMETKALRAANRAIRLVEDRVALHADILGQDSTVTTTADQEKTAEPTGLIRLESLWVLNPDTSLPWFPLTPIHKVADHSVISAGSTMLDFILNLAANSKGRPNAYLWYGSNFYWDRVPDGTYTIRWYGFARHAAVDETDTITYDAALCTGIAQVAVDYFKFEKHEDDSKVIALADRHLMAWLEREDRRWQDGNPAMTMASMYDS